MSVNKHVKDGFYRKELNKSDWEVPNRYQHLNLIGYGAFGQVCSAIDTVTGRKVAIKKLSRPFQSGMQAKRTYREIRLLKHMQHDNVIGLVDLFTPDEIFEDFDEVYLVTVLMAGDLNKLIKQHKLSEDHIQFFIYQVLRALKYIHSAGVIHRDLKPGNIAVNEDLELRILDFGLARQTDDQMTGYVATRWYRAPEVMLNWTHYNQTMDVWSVGCIMAEMLTGKPLFPGGDQIDQLTHILSLVGTPNDRLLDKIDSQDAREYVKQLPKWKKKDFKEVFKGVNPQAVDLLERMLDLDADTRISAEQVLAHPYMSQYADPSDEPTAPTFDDSFESTNYSVLEWRKLVFDEAMGFKPTESEGMETQ